ncbi:MAG: glycosyltransferase [Candidatus Latescibacterota bacterium]
MKICDLTQSYTSTSGGIRTYIEEKRRYIEKNTSWEHVLIIPGESDSSSQEGRLTVHTVASPFIPGCEPYRIVLRLGHILSILADERPDIIELGCAYTLPWTAYHHRKNYSCKVIGFYHTDFPSAYVETTVRGIFGETTGKRAKLIASQYARLVYNRCDQVLTPSRMLRKNLTKYGVKKVEYMPLGVDLDIFSPSRRDPSFRKKLGIDESQIMLVYTGRLDSEKRVNVLVEAVKQIPPKVPVTLVLAGNGPLREQLQISEMDNPRIKIIPYITDKVEMAVLLASSDIYITAGPHETFGLSVLEAQACGLPVVGVKAGALIERVHPSFGILGKPDNIEQMAKNIVMLSRNGFHEMGLNARNFVAATFSWNKTFQRIFDLYQSL